MHITRARAAYARALVPLLLASFAACSDEGVTTPPPDQGVAITTAAPSVELARSEQASVTVRITRPAEFTGPVTLGVTGAPAGVAVALTPTEVAGDTAVLSVDASEAAPVGTYPLVLSASGAGVRNSTATLELRITAPPAVTAVTIPYCTARAPMWAAFRDGDGPWTRAAVTTSGGRAILSHEFASSRGAIATVTQVFGEQFTLLRVVYGSPAELATEADTLRASCEQEVTRTWNGHALGFGADEKGFVSTGLLRSASTLPTGHFQLVGVTPGPQDVLATRTKLTDGVETVTGFILRRDIDVPDQALLPNFDFASAETFAAATGTLTIAGAGADAVVSTSELHTRNSRLAQPFLTRDPFLMTRPYFALPADRLREGDLQLLHLGTDASSGSSRTADVYFRTPGDRTLALGVPITAPTLAVEPGGTSLRVRALFGALNDYDQSAVLLLARAGATALVSVTASASYYPVPSSGFELVVPDLSAVDGFNSAWMLTRDAATPWAAVRIGGTVPFGRTAVPTDGAVRRTALVQGTLAAP